jgi:exonuclease I
MVVPVAVEVATATQQLALETHQPQPHLKETMVERDTTHLLITEVQVVELEPLVQLGVMVVLVYLLP